MTERTVLHDLQKAAGGKIIDFHGWDMPVQFTSIATEHQSVRTAAGLFDLGHMGRLHVQGTGSLRFLERRVCRPLADMASGAVRYGLVLADDGTVEDDVLVSREGPDAWHVVVNASNKDKVLTLWRDGLGGDVVVRDLSAEQAMVAVQGPQALSHLSAIGLDGTGMKYYSFRDVTWHGTTVRLSRTGYTGEDGYECFMPAVRAAELWQALAGRGVALCGLGSRDTLRLEAGMPLYGNELDRAHTPVEAGLGFAVNKQGGFIGDTIVLEQLAKGPARKLVGIRMCDKRVPRSRYPILVGGTAAGEVTSGTLSPTLGAAIGMAYVSAAHASDGTRVQVDIRGTTCDADIVKLPFYKRAKAQ
ncbi:MAG: glycine cleavage system aminomethyltransferase GcvT [Planctomycetes bacterium]|nr:glycine cleavage system aminomethyltransferase GcvT [Planctomycetota bacterium]